MNTKKSLLAPGTSSVDIDEEVERDSVSKAGSEPKRAKTNSDLHAIQGRAQSRTKLNKSGAGTNTKDRDDSTVSPKPDAASYPVAPSVTIPGVRSDVVASLRAFPVQWKERGHERLSTRWVVETMLECFLEDDVAERIKQVRIERLRNPRKVDSGRESYSFRTQRADIHEQLKSSPKLWAEAEPGEPGTTQGEVFNDAYDAFVGEEALVERVVRFRLERLESDS